MDRDPDDARALEELETVQEKGEIGGGLGREAVVLEADIVRYVFLRLPAIVVTRRPAPGGASFRQSTRMAADTAIRVHITARRKTVAGSRWKR